MQPLPATEGSIKLPVPMPLVDSQSLRWSEESIPSGGALAGNLSSSLLGLPTGSNYGNLGNVAGAELARFANRKTSNLFDYALQGAGLALNPLLTMMFKNPEFKKHQFSWAFSPNSRKESATLNSILKALKMASLPSTYAGGVFFKYPNMLLMRLRDEKTTYTFKPAVINNITVDYAAGGRPSFFEGDAGSTYPSNITLSLDLVEIILNTKTNVDLGADDVKSFILNNTGKASQIINKAVKVL